MSLWQFGEYLTTLPPGSKPITFTIDDCKNGAARALKSLHQYARIFPIGRPRAALWQGFYEWMTGNQSKAFQTWAKGLEIAKTLGLAWEQARIHYEVGRRHTARSSKREYHLKEADKIFTSLGSEFDSDRVQREIAAGSSQS